MKLSYRAELLFSIFFLSYSIISYPQSTISVTGGKATGSGGTVSYTVGETSFKFRSGSSGTVSEGVQQPYEISIATSTLDFKDIELDFSVYPNPTTDQLTLRVGRKYETMKLTYFLYSVKGNIIESKKVSGSETGINIKSQGTGVYFLKVTTGELELITFKIIKN